MAILANGTELHKIDKADGSIESTFTNLTTLGEIGGEVSDIDITTLSSVAKEYTPGMVDFGELSLEMNATPEDYALLKTDFDGKVIGEYAITFPVEMKDADCKFKGYLKTCKISGIEPDGVLKISAALKLSGGLTDFVKPTTP